MGTNGRLTGREERRLPIMMEVNLAPAGRVIGDKCERTFTDNISAHGIRVQSTVAWCTGEKAEVTPMKGESPMLGEVVYCQKVRNNQFFVGLRFWTEHIPWSMLQRFNGLTHTDILGAMRWSDENGRQGRRDKT